MKLYQKYIVLILVILLFSFVYFYLQNKKEFVNRVQIVLLNLLERQIGEEKEKAFSFAYSLSQIETLKKAIEEHDSKLGYDILNRYMRTLERFSGTTIRTQILTKDFVIFARSWDNRDAGLNVKKYRPDLAEMMHSLKPHLSYEAARRLVLIASIPIVRDGKLIGFIEVIQRPDTLETYLSHYDIDLLVLLDSRYKDQAVLLQKHPRIGHMIVANDNANVHYIDRLRQYGVDRLLNHGILEGKKAYYFAKSILNAEGQNIGSFVMVLTKKKLKLFSAFEEEIDSFLTYARKDLYYSTIRQNPTFNLYQNMTAKELLMLKGATHAEDQIALKQRLREELKNYSQEELISLLLDANTNRKSRGKIK